MSTDQKIMAIWAQDKLKLKKTPSQSTISRILKKAKQDKFYHGLGVKIKDRTGSNHTLEIELYPWVCDKNCRRIRVSGRISCYLVCKHLVSSIMKGIRPIMNPDDETDVVDGSTSGVQILFIPINIDNYHWNYFVHICDSGVFLKHYVTAVYFGDSLSYKEPRGLMSTFKLHLEHLFPYLNIKCNEKNNSKDILKLSNQAESFRFGIQVLTVALQLSSYRVLMPYKYVEDEYALVETTRSCCTYYF